jgi:ABC-type lipoprotein release transport system permease subunit
MVQEKWFHSEPLASLISTGTWLFASLAALLLAVLAAWLPAVLACQKDPAEILHHD